MITYFNHIPAACNVLGIVSKFRLFRQLINFRSHWNIHKTNGLLIGSRVIEVN